MTLSEFEGHFCCY